jgi:uncharacterized protein
VPLPRFVTWQRTDVRGLGSARLDRGEGWELDAHEIVAGRSPYSIYYGISLTDDWRTEHVSLGITRRAVSFGTQFEVDHESGAWWIGGRRRRALDGCVDIDIAATPATNTISIRRLALRVGQEATVRVVWVDVPSLRAVPAEQGYRRIGRDTYEFWPVGGRTYRLTVDADDLVVDYEDFAEPIGGWSKENQ